MLVGEFKVSQAQFLVLLRVTLDRGRIHAETGFSKVGRGLRGELVRLPLLDLRADGLADYVEVVWAWRVEREGGIRGKWVRREECRRRRQELETERGKGLNLDVELKWRDARSHTRPKHKLVVLHDNRRK